MGFECEQKMWNLICLDSKDFPSPVWFARGDCRDGGRHEETHTKLHPNPLEYVKQIPSKVNSRSCFSFSKVLFYDYLYGTGKKKRCPLTQSFMCILLGIRFSCPFQTALRLFSEVPIITIFFKMFFFSFPRNKTIKTRCDSLLTFAKAERGLIRINHSLMILCGSRIFFTKVLSLYSSNNIERIERASMLYRLKVHSLKVHYKKLVLFNMKLFFYLNNDNGFSPVYDINL